VRTHITILGWLLIVLHGIDVLLGLLLFLMFSGGAAATAAGGGGAGVAAFLGGIGLFLGGILAIIGLPGVIVGWGILKQAQWARIGGVIMSVLTLFHFPIGTAIGAYGLYVLFNPETTAIFEGRFSSQPY